MRTLSAAHLRQLLDLQAGVAVGYRDLAAMIRMLVLDGRVTPGTRLPSERELTAALPVSRTTVTRAYGELRELGFVRSRQGSGTTVALPRQSSGLRMVSVAHDEPDLITWTIAAGQAASGVGLAYARACDLLPDFLGQTGYVLAGVDELRQQVAVRYGERGLPTDPEQVVITSGAQSALALVARSLGEVGQQIMTDSPTYPNAIESMRRSGLRPVGVPMTGTGWDLDALEATIAQTAPHWAYLVPDFHNPTGALMTDTERARLGRCLTRHGVVPIVDESMCDLVLDDVPIPLPFAAHAPGAITIGSASKSFWGGLRVGWVRVDHDQVTPMVQARSAYDLGTPVLEQIVVSELLRERRSVMAARVAVLVDQRSRLRTLLSEHLPDYRLNDPGGGLSFWARLPGRDSTRLTIAAEEHRLLLTAGPRFFVGGGGEGHLRLPYSRPRDDLEEAVRRLALADELVRSRRALRAGSRTPALTA